MGWEQGFKMGSDVFERGNEAKRQAALDAQNAQLFEVKMADVARANAERAGLIQASKQAVVSEDAATLDTGSGAKMYDMMGGADVAASDARQFRGMQEATTGEAAPLPQVQPGKFSVNGKEYADKGGMQAAAAAYNSPEARTQRQAAVYDTSGNLMQAEAIRSNANKSKLEGYQVAEAQTKHENRLINEALDKTVRNSPDQWTGMASFATDSQVGQLAGVKIRAQQSSDGKTMRFVSTMPDGSENPGKTYDNTDEGFARARTDFMAMDPASRSQLVAEQHKMKREDAKDAREERRVTVAEKAQASTELKNEAFMARMLGGGRSSGQGQPGSVALKDRRDYLSDFSDALPSPKTANSPQEAQDISNGNQRILAQADAVFSTNAELGIVLTAPQAASAMRLAQDPANIKIIRDNNTGISYETVSVNGRPVMLGAGSVRAKDTAPTGAAAPTSAPTTMVKTVKSMPDKKSSDAPTYDKWMAAKDAKDELLKKAGQMTASAGSAYLESRLPQVEQAIKFNWNYPTN